MTRRRGGIDPLAPLSVRTAGEVARRSDALKRAASHWQEES